MSTGRDRPDACPGALRPHQAADGALVRVRLPGGRATSAQVAALGRAAEGFGSGGLELTSRANVQLRGVDPARVGGLAAALAAAGLLPSATHERVRNIMASPLSGLDGRGLADVRPLVGALDAALCARPALAALPGRFLFALDDGRGDLPPRADVAARAVGPDRFTVRLAGVETGLRVAASGVVAVLLAAAESFLLVRADMGSSAWRLTELPEAVPAVIAALEAGGFEGEPPQGASRTGWQESAARLGLVADGVVVAGAPLGRLSAEQVGLLTEWDGIVVTPWRSVVVTGGPETVARLAAHGFVTAGRDALAGVTACTGRPGCAKALADVRADAVAVMVPGEGRVHWSGCERRCGRPEGQVVDVVATGGGYRVGEGRVLSSLVAAASAVRAARRD
ncbi:precorrin-3B synthase [Actinocorallia sp. API 0066]|uniref:precorrin-3B synthase n=1 Tax=Actinocorallia sp. API 0066 TaxID=2896846 RepID=UPI001E3C82C1|nr:precorrin-3B synthase [Actinocorallia sp. API 0066]MCD0448826.1 precorrin-3B synthase [Actinocorallia sp. API 0066]